MCFSFKTGFSRRSLSQNRKWLSNYIMLSNNRFRKSDCKLQDLDNLFCQQQIKKLRNSLTNNYISPLDFSSFRTTVSNQSIPLPPSPQQSRACKRTPTYFQEQLASIQEKLSNAKQQLSHNATKEEKPKKKQQTSLKYLPKNKVIYEWTPKVGTVENLKKSRIEEFTNMMPKPKNIVPFLANPYNSIRNNSYYISEVVRAIHQKNSLAVEHIETSIIMLKEYVMALQNYSASIADKQKIILPSEGALQNRKTLVLDLDETLIHCLENTECESDLKLKTVIDSTTVDIELVIRPYALTFLKKISKKWEVIIFTASHQNYADVILDQLDPDHVIFHHRLYRQHCTKIQSLFIKDLSRINRDLKKMVLVDNAAYSYAMQIDNGIPILPYYDGKDYELSVLESYLDKLNHCEDVREMNHEYFKLSRYTQFCSSKDLIEELYVKGKKSTLN